MTITLRTLSENTAGSIGIQAEWGWSILVETEDKRILVDTGAGETAVKNADLKGVPLKGIDAILLSHAHADHTGGLKNVLERTGKVRVLAHPALWVAKYKTDEKGENPRYNGIPFARAELEKLGSFSLDDKPVELAKGVLTTGEVPLVTDFETPETHFLVEQNGVLVPDTFPDDQALILTRPEGLVIVLGCAHRGIVNTILHARKLTGVEHVRAVVGGTHLYPKNDVQVEKTIQALKDLEVEAIGVSHCTGHRASVSLANAFESAFFLNSAGTEIVFQ